jgi:cytoskeletal protein CcmA (bactofilin family)
MLKSFMQSGTSSSARTDSTKPAQPAYAPTRPVESARTAEPTKVETAPVATPPAPNEEGSKLIVGPNIKLKGSEITDCEILVVEGRVEASMKSRVIRIAEGGVFAGKAEIDVAEVYGNFEGELTARTRLVIHATGKVSGVIRYGAMMGEGGTFPRGGDADGRPQPGPSPKPPRRPLRLQRSRRKLEGAGPLLSSLACNQVVAKRQADRSLEV